MAETETLPEAPPTPHTPMIWGKGQKGKNKRDKALLRTVGFDQILIWRAEGATVAEITDVLIPAATGEISPVSSFWLYSMMKRTEEGEEDRKLRWQEAGTVRAALLAEEAGQVLEDEAAKGLMLTSEHVQLAKARADHRRWEAAKLDPATYGDSKSNVQGNTVNIGTLHLHALQKRSRKRAVANPIPDTPMLSPGQPDPSATPSEVVDADYEVIP